MHPEILAGVLRSRKYLLDPVDSWVRKSCCGGVTGLVSWRE
jgi:hypothetical protein